MGTWPGGFGNEQAICWEFVRGKGTVIDTYHNKVSLKALLSYHWAIRKVGGRKFFYGDHTNNKKKLPTTIHCLSVCLSEIGNMTRYQFNAYCACLWL